MMCIRCVKLLVGGYDLHTLSIGSQKYINPRATEDQILRMGHLMVILSSCDFSVCAIVLIGALQVAFYALVIALAGLIFFYIGVSMGWLYVSHIPPVSVNRHFSSQT